MFDHHHRVALVDEPLQDVEQVLDVGEVQARGGLVEDVERASGGHLGELGGELDPLGFTTRERGRRLAELDVAETDVVQGDEAAGDARHVAEERAGVVDAHVEDLGDVLALEVDLERVAVVALALAGFAGHVDVGQEVHLDLDLAVALADLAAPALDIEAEASGLVAAHL